MSQTAQANEVASERTEATEAFSLTQIKTKDDVGLASAATIATKITEQQAVQQVKEFFTKIQPHVKAMTAAAYVYKITSENVSEILGPIWEEFKGLSPLMKFFAVLGAAMVVGAIGSNWKSIKGNWPTIQNFVVKEMENVEKNAIVLSEDIAKNPIVLKLKKMFEDKAKELTITKAEAEAIVKAFSQNGVVGIAATFLEAIKAKPK